MEQIVLDNELVVYMYLLRCSLSKRLVEQEAICKYGKVDVAKLVERSLNNNQRLLLEDAIKQYAEYTNQNMTSTYESALRFILIQYEKYKAIRCVVDEARNKGIRLVIFKGCVLADLYPDYIKRVSSDTDIFVYEEDNCEACELLVGLGYDRIEAHSNAGVTVFYNDKKEHTIELHTCLWEDYEGKRLDVLKSYKLTEPDSLIDVKVCGFDVTTLGYTEHLIYQIFHIAKHFSLEGIGVNYLADIALYVNAYIDKIDIERFWNCMEELGYRKFCYTILAVCSEFLEMDKKILSNNAVPVGTEIAEFLNDLFEVGNANDGKDNWLIMGMMTPYFTGQRSASKYSFKRKLDVIFPKASDLPDEYAYARDNRILLPIAWGHKALKYLIKYNKNKKTWYNAGEKLDVAERRLSLMKDMGLI